MITLPLRFRLVGLPENGCDLLSLQIAHRRPIHLLYRDTCNLRALCYRQGFAIGDKGEEAVDCRQATVAGTHRHFAIVLKVLQEREHFTSVEVTQRERVDGSLPQTAGQSPL